MNELESLMEIKKEDVLNILDRTIGFVNNCDSKASVVLGVFGVLLTILFSSEGVTEIKNIIKIAINNGTWCGIVYFIFLLGAGLMFAFGIFKLIQVLFPKTDCDDLKQDDIELDSKIFFGNISKNYTYKQYKEKLQNCSEDEYMNDIISQIYLNAIICSRKFKNYKNGVVITIIGFMSFLAVWGIGILLY